jgi:glutamine amidotransferase
VKLAVLDYGIGNLRSAQKAFEHLGGDARLTSDPAAVSAADAVVLPGVGAFGACVDALNDSGMAAVALDAIASGVPFLGICVGMQMLYSTSEEDATHEGLGVFPRAIRRLSREVKVPQMQWNELEFADGAHPMFDGLDRPWVYFVHSFAAEIGPETIATCEYGGPVTAAVARGNVWATQFHPEKSGTVGLAVLNNFMKWAAAGAPADANTESPRK